jgi:hypothetical protein
MTGQACGYLLGGEHRVATPSGQLQPAQRVRGGRQSAVGAQRIALLSVTIIVTRDLGLHAARRTLHKKRAQTPLRPAPKFQDASTPDPYCMFPLACSPWLRVAIAPDGSVTAVRRRVDPAHATALGRPRGRRSSDRSLAGVFRSLRNGLYGRGRCVRPPRSRWRAQSESGTRRSRCDAGRRSCGPIVGRAPASRSDRNQVIRAVIGPSSR